MKTEEEIRRVRDKLLSGAPPEFKWAMRQFEEVEGSFLDVVKVLDWVLGRGEEDE